jgi:hypothetical protein
VVAASGGQHRQAEIALVGREGMTGLPVVHGADRSPCETFIQVEGEGQCISSQNLRQLMDQSITMLAWAYNLVAVVRGGRQVVPGEGTSYQNCRADAGEAQKPRGLRRRAAKYCATIRLKERQVVGWT